MSTETLRAAFEAWAAKETPPYRLERVLVPVSDLYAWNSTACAWEAFQAGAIAAAEQADPVETEESVMAYAYLNIAQCIGTLPGYSVFEHVETIREALQSCSDFLHNFDESDPEAVSLAADVRNALRGRIDLVRSAAEAAKGESS